MSSQVKRSAVPVMVFFVVDLFAGAALADPAVIDQSNTGGIFFVSPLFGDFAQSFKPIYDQLDFVALEISTSSEPGGTLRVDLRDGGVAGPVLGSATRVIPADTIELIRFEFPSPLSLTPGAVYVIDLNAVSGNANWGYSPSSYPDGSAFVDGIAAMNDFGFQTGMLVGAQVFKDAPTPLEYSDAFDERAVPGGGDHDVPDPGQVLYTEPPAIAVSGYPRDATDFFPALETGTQGPQVDALANKSDVFFSELVHNGASLILSFNGDGFGLGTAAYYQTPDGTRDVAFLQQELNQLNGAPGVLDDVDGLELWGPDGVEDAVFYSLESDFAQGVSVYVYTGGAAIAFIAQPDIVSVVTTLGYIGDPKDVDVDALMVQDVGTPDQHGLGDGVIFSIRATGNFDGGEIIYWRTPAAPVFLTQGNQKFATALSLSDLFGVNTEEIDALEAQPFTPPPSIPTLGLWGLGTLAVLLLALGGRHTLARR